jgi:hypothetical protein
MRGAAVRDLMTTLLDTLGLLLIAAGITAGLLPIVGGWAFCAGGVTVVLGSWLATRGDGR